MDRPQSEENQEEVLIPYITRARARQSREFFVNKSHVPNRIPHLHGDHPHDDCASACIQSKPTSLLETNRYGRRK